MIAGPGNSVSVHIRRGRLRGQRERVTAGLFAGLAVSEHQRALIWYKLLLGSEPAFLPNATEAVWELAGHRYLYLAELPGRAGRALVTVFVDDLDDRVGSIRARGIQPAAQETYGNSVRKVIYRDPDGNEIGFGGAPLK